MTLGWSHKAQGTQWSPHSPPEPQCPLTGAWPASYLCLCPPEDARRGRTQPTTTSFPSHNPDLCPLSAHTRASPAKEGRGGALQARRGREEGHGGGVEEEEAGAGGAQAPGNDAGPEGEAERWWRWRGRRQACRNWGEFVIPESDLTKTTRNTMQC